MRVSCRIVGWVNLDDLASLLRAVYTVEFPFAASEIARIDVRSNRGNIFLPKYNDATVQVAPDRWALVAKRDNTRSVVDAVRSNRCTLLAFPLLLLQRYAMQFAVGVTGTVHLAMLPSDPQTVELVFTYNTSSHTEHVFLAYLTAMLPYLQVSNAEEASDAALQSIQDYTPSSESSDDEDDFDE